MSAAFGILLASLAGSPHCAAMCGPFVAFYAVGAAPGAPRRWMHMAYNGGRLVAYLALGITAGTLGAGIERAGSLAGVARAAAIAAGVLMVAWGLDTLVALLGWRRSMLHAPASLQRAVSGLLTATGGLPATVRAGVTGLATALLPCGWLYAFVAAAAGTASPLHGALVMLLFWSGTLPVMAGLGLGMQRLAGPLRARLPLVTATAVVAIGLLTITGRLRPIGIPFSGAHAPMAAPDIHAGHR